MSTNIYEEKRRALLIREAARTCGISRATVYRLIADGKSETLKIAHACSSQMLSHRQ
jgi:predicted DNA-binding transcriptional regulator AlpA